METVVGVPVIQAYLPTVSTTTQQSFLRRCSRGPQNSRVFEILTSDNRPVGATVVAHFPSRAVLLDVAGRPLLHATISAGLGYKNLSVKTAHDGQQVCKGYSGVFGGCTLNLNGHKYNLKGSTKYKAYGFLAENGASAFGCYDGRDEVVVDAGVDPLLAVLLATCVENMCVSEGWRFLLIP